MEELAKLPPIALVTFGAVLAVIFAARYLGLWQGRKSAPASDGAQVAAVIVDPTALNRAASAGEALAEAIKSLTRLSDDHAHMICRRLEGLADAVEAQTAAINSLILEMARRSGK